MRSHSLSLHTCPALRSAGAFSDDERSLAWVQPRDCWQLLLLEHAGEFRLSSRPVPVAKNDVVVVPPGARCDLRREGELPWVYVYALFVPCNSERDVVSAPVCQGLGAAGPFWNAELRRALDHLKFGSAHVSAVLWALLWRVSRPEHVLTRSVYVEEAERIFAARLSERLRVADVARLAGVSPSFLTRQFMLEHGTTPMQFLQSLRASRAHRLLTSTTMPVKQVASACGIPDAAQFSRFVRSRFGASPRTLRAERPETDVYRSSEYGKAAAGPPD
jgi:AraC-like DNA-binding protein